MIEYHSNVWVNAPGTNINAKSTVLCTESSETVTLTETTKDTMCTSGIITDVTSGREKRFKNLKNSCILWNSTLVVFED